MSRWIDAETLVRWICGNKCGCERDECGHDIPCQQVQLLEGAPSIDIVRCQDCKYWIGHIADDDGFDGEDECRWRDSEAPNADDFCSYGEREGE